jgi:uncharacterized iron-regulated protein
MRRHLGLAAFLLGLAMACTASAQAPAEGKDYAVFAGREPVTFTRMADELAKYDVVCVGENHDHAMAHRLEFAILQALQPLRAKLALSLEFFERDVQTILDEYLQGHITESHFKQSSRPWPTYATDYAPMVDFCRTNRLPVIAANAPRRYVNIVSRKGRAALSDLPRDSREFLPRLPYAMELPDGYDRMLNDLFGGVQHGGGATAPSMPQVSVDRIKEAQGLWDATMAESILRYRKAHRGALVLQMNGAGHSDHGWGIVDRLRKADPRLKVAIVSIKPDGSFPNQPGNKYEGVADFLILTPVVSETGTKAAD